MGNFYTNITLRGPDQDATVAFLNEQRRPAYVAPTVNGCTIVFDEACETQDTDILEALAAQLSQRFACPALAVLNHDDDILWYKLYDAGQALDEYNSAPDYFGDEEGAQPTGGDARKLCRAFKAEQNLNEVERILRAADEYVFALEQHDELVRALGLPTFAVGTGYNYLVEDDAPEGLDTGSLKHTGDG
jgi:hypothetical protein